MQWKWRSALRKPKGKALQRSDARESMLGRALKKMWGSSGKLWNEISRAWSIPRLGAN
jgi:hypothetical protein